MNLEQPNCISSQPAHDILLYLHGVEHSEPTPKDLSEMLAEVRSQLGKAELCSNVSLGSSSSMELGASSRSRPAMELSLFEL